VATLLLLNRGVDLADTALGSATPERSTPARQRHGNGTATARQR